MDVLETNLRMILKEAFEEGDSQSAVLALHKIDGALAAYTGEGFVHTDPESCDSYCRAARLDGFNL